MSFVDGKYLGFKSIGKDCKISVHAHFYNPENISIGDNVRIDDFCILSAGSGGIEIGSNIHIACFVSMIGAGKITLHDNVQIAAGCRLISSTDDFSGFYLVGPCVDDNLRNVTSKPITLNKYVVLGAGTKVMPDVVIGVNSATGADTFVKKDIPRDEIWIGNPARYLKVRLPNILMR